MMPIDRAGEGDAPSPAAWRRRQRFSRHIPLLLALAALTIAVYALLTRGEPPRPSAGAGLRGSPAVPRLLILLLAGVGARVVLRGLVQAVVALVLLVLLLDHWPTVLGVLDGLAPGRLL
jgi:hypothetical protein